MPKDVEGFHTESHGAVMFVLYRAGAGRMSLGGRELFGCELALSPDSLNVFKCSQGYSCGVLDKSTTLWMPT